MKNSTTEGVAVDEVAVHTDGAPHATSIKDVEGQNAQTEKPGGCKQKSAFASLGWLDRFLAVWILLAMIVGVLLGNFVEDVGPALQKGKFVGVSIPIGTFIYLPLNPQPYLDHFAPKLATNGIESLGCD
jgi:hypothetical protein